MSKGNVEDISPEQALSELKTSVFLDARSEAEYSVSHIKGAKRIGFDDVSVDTLSGIPKDKRLVVYCAVGYRSERVGEKLKELGYTNVVNIKGSIFAWANKQLPLVDGSDTPTKKVHSYNEANKRWLAPGVEAVTN
jgi:rhodanese-related sulfurtransferase